MGKGEGKGGKGKGGKETRTCHNCNKAGHIARDCWSKGKPKGKGKGKGAKERGNDGKWYRKGVNSWELEEDQQDGEGEWTAEEQPEAGVYAFSATGGLGGGLAEEDDGYHSLHALEDEDSDTQSAHAGAKVASSSESEAGSIFSSPEAEQSWTQFLLSRSDSPEAVEDAVEEDHDSVNATADAEDGNEDEKDPWKEGGDAWSDFLVLKGGRRPTGPPRKGKPVLMKTAGGVDKIQDAEGTPAKSKPVHDALAHLGTGQSASSAWLARISATRPSIGPTSPPGMYSYDAANDVHTLSSAGEYVDPDPENRKFMT